MHVAAPEFLAVFVVALLYSSVGHGGASGYLAILALMSVPRQAASSTALILNVIVASMSTIAFYRAKYLSFRKTLNYLVFSVPAAFMGGALHVPGNLYELLLAVSLLLAAVRLVMPIQASGTQMSQSMNVPPAWQIGLAGGIIGLISGIVGIGGGIFLSPLIVLARWDDAKNASGTAALFIVINSIAGILGRIVNQSLVVTECLPLLFAAVCGGSLGSYVGANLLSNTTLKRVLAVVLGLASLKLLTA